mgnify:CR=1 FL=1
MPITQAFCTSFKTQLFQAAHDFRTSGSGGDTFKIALYTSAANLDGTTTAYTATGEVSGTGYVAGGNTLTNVAPASSGTTAFVDFADTTWAAATITARGALIYNTTPTSGLGLTNPSCVVLDFGSDKTSTDGDFTVIFPAATAGDAIIRIN